MFSAWDVNCAEKDPPRTPMNTRVVGDTSRGRQRVLIMQSSHVNCQMQIPAKDGASVTFLTDYLRSASHHFYCVTTPPGLKTADTPYGCIAVCLHN
jgi:hypothetical protein